MNSEDRPVFGESPRSADMRGVGGSLYSPYSEERGGLGPVLVQKKAEPSAPFPGTENPSPPHSSEAKGSSVHGTLEALGVLVLAPAQQRVVALTLVGAGVTVEQILLIAGWVYETEEDPGKRRKFLAATLSDPARCLESVRQIAAYRAAHADDGPAHMPNMPIGTLACGCRRCVEARKRAADKHWDYDEQCLRVSCYASDGRTMAELCDIFNLKHESVARAMVDRGNAMKTPDPRLVAFRGAVKAAAADKAETEARLQRVREMLADRRAVRP